jgi:hypothetical protein
MRPANPRFRVTINANLYDILALPGASPIKQAIVIEALAGEQVALLPEPDRTAVLEKLRAALGQLPSSDILVIAERANLLACEGATTWTAATRIGISRDLLRSKIRKAGHPDIWDRLLENDWNERRDAQALMRKRAREGKVS